MTFSATVNSSLEKALSSLAEAVAHRAVERQKEESTISLLRAEIRELRSENDKLRQEIEQEKLATKVIDRLGRSPTALPTTPARRRRKSEPAQDDDLQTLTDTIEARAVHLFPAP